MADSADLQPMLSFNIIAETVGQVSSHKLGSCFGVRYAKNMSTRLK